MSWRRDETYSKVKGVRPSRSRAGDKAGKPIDFLRTEHRDEPAAKRFLPKALRRPGGGPEKSTSDGRAANEAAIKRDNEDHGTVSVMRQTKYLHTIVEQEHRASQRVTRPMVGCQAFDAAQATLSGMERMPMLRKGQRAGGREQGRSAAEQFSALAA
jgi:transposase-like protein